MIIKFQILSISYINNVQVQKTCRTFHTLKLRTGLLHRRLPLRTSFHHLQPQRQTTTLPLQVYIIYSLPIQRSSPTQLLLQLQNRVHSKISICHSRHSGLGSRGLTPKSLKNECSRQVSLHQYQPKRSRLWSSSSNKTSYQITSHKK